MKETAIGYVRVSTEEQFKFGASLDAQEARIRAYAMMKDLDLIAILREEGVSGSTAIAARPLGGQMVSQLADKTVKHVIAVKLDRLFRSAEDALRQTTAWDKAGTVLHLVDISGIAMDTSGAMGRFLLTVMAGFAELERNLIAERTAATLGFKKSKLEIYGNVPYGYTAKGKKLISDRGEQKVIARIQDLRRGGASLRSIASQLNREGVKCKRGGQEWYASTVTKLLNNSLRTTSAA